MMYDRKSSDHPLLSKNLLQEGASIVTGKNSSDIVTAHFDKGDDKSSHGGFIDTHNFNSTRQKSVTTPDCQSHGKELKPGRPQHPDPLSYLTQFEVVFD